MVLAYPLIKKAKELFSQAELYFLTFRRNRYAIDILDFIPSENVLTISDDSIVDFLKTTKDVIKKLRKERMSAVIDMEFFARFTAIISYFSRANSRVGYFKFNNEGLYRGNFLTHRVFFNPHIHISYNLLNLIYALHSDQKDIPLAKRPVDDKDIFIPKMKSSSDKKNNILTKLNNENPDVSNARELILINPNASDLVPLRRWPIENYIELAKRLLEQDGVYVIITGTEQEQKDADCICNSLASERCINFAGKTTFSELIDLYNVSDILITNDSGPAHFSTLTDIKTYILFGPETPNLYGPIGKNAHVFYSNYACSPCISVFNHRKSACNNNKCLIAISAHEVYEEVKKQT